MFSAVGGTFFGTPTAKMGRYHSRWDKDWHTYRTKEEEGERDVDRRMINFFFSCKRNCFFAGD